MANQDLANRVMQGSDGNVWLNGQLLGNLSKIEAKVKADQEDINFCGDKRTYKKRNGWSGEGTLTLKKVDSALFKIVADAFKTGIDPDVKIITSVTDKTTGASERASIEGITFSEFVLASFEAKKILEEEYPFSFSDYEVLETI